MIGLVLQLPSCEAGSKVPRLASVGLFPHLQSGDKDAYFPAWLEGLKETTSARCLAYRR